MSGVRHGQEPGEMTPGVVYEAMTVQVKEDYRTTEFCERVGV
jgi:hypothetical protein